MLSVKYSWSGFVAIALSVHMVFAEVQAPLKVLPPNLDYHQPVETPLYARGVLNLFERQSGCYSPNLYCALYNKCCYSTELGCCPSGCTTEIPNECCLTNDGYCTTGYECCGQGCMPTGSECCSDGGHCPSPFRCVLYDGVVGCCTDLTCSVYLSSGVPVTVTAAPTAAPTVATTLQYTEYYYTYTTWIYWYYWYYYYTIYYSPSTYITREITTITQTTTVTFSATDTYQASILYSSLSADLPTPTYAEVTIPATPTAGALIIGSCSSTSISTFTDIEGSTSVTTVSVCDTSTADGISISSSTTSSSSPSRTSTSRATATTTPSGGSGGSSGTASGAASDRVTWLLCALIPAFIGGAMIVL